MSCDTQIHPKAWTKMCHPSTKTSVHCLEPKWHMTVAHDKCTSPWMKRKLQWKLLSDGWRPSLLRLEANGNCQVSQCKLQTRVSPRPETTETKPRWCRQRSNFRPHVTQNCASKGIFFIVATLESIPIPVSTKVSSSLAAGQSAGMFL